MDIKELVENYKKKRFIFTSIITGFALVILFIVCSEGGMNLGFPKTLLLAAVFVFFSYRKFKIRVRRYERGLQSRLEKTDSVNQDANPF